jgi:hypothetical protein
VRRVEDARAPYDPMPHGPDEVGVGPWDGPWPDDPRYDPELLEHGDRRNVVDRYRYWRREAVVVSVAQYGSTRSINAGAAAAVAMHAWVRQHVLGHPL